MWHVENSTPFEAAGNWVRDRRGGEVWVVAVRCTFTLTPDGRLRRADVQEPPVLAPTFVGEPNASSMLDDSDFHLTKPTTDIVIHGRAHAPLAKRVAQVDVTARVGTVQKTLRVTGNRRYERHGGGYAAGRAEPFDVMPITYERAYGGGDDEAEGHRRCDVRNPIGTGFAPRADALAPNVAYPDRRSVDTPAGFGPLAPHWMPRVSYGGTYDAAWQRKKMPLYPDDLDDRFFLCSPEDQRPERHLRGGEAVELINLTPNGHLTFTLPRLAFRFETRFRGKGRTVHRGVLSTVIIHPDQGRLVMVWQSPLPAHVDVHRLEETLVRPLDVVALGTRPSAVAT